MLDEDAPTAPTKYLSTHLTTLRDGLGYSRGSYAAKSYATFGTSLPTDRGAAILEIGPGGCEFAELLQRDHHYADITVVDREPEVIEVARGLGLHTVATETDLAPSLLALDRRYDALVMFHVLEHLPKTDTIPVLTAMRQAAAPDGVVLIEVPNMGDPFNGVYARYADFTHEVGFTEESLRFVLEQAGFTRIEFLDPLGATGRVSRPLQRLARALLHLGLRAVSLPNGRQMRRRIDPVLAVVARA